LHGAPAHLALRQTSERIDGATMDSNLFRITLLVNVWVRHKPGAVAPLPEAIRRAVQENAARLSDSDLETLESDSFERKSSFEKVNVSLTDDQERIELPFVGKGATWGGSDEVWVAFTYPPPVHETDTLLLSFGDGMAAYIEAVEQDSKSDEDWQ
jgi:hypothetical protein